MALAFRITKAKYEKLGDELKNEYAADGDGHFKLDVTGLEDNGALRRAKERAEEELAEVRTELKTLETDNKTLGKEVKTLKAAQTGEQEDVQRLEARLTRKHTQELEAKDEAISTRDAFIEKTLKTSTAKTLATEISTVPSLMEKHVLDRLTVDLTGDEPKLVILGKDGKADPKLDIDGLRKEILANPEFKPILTANKATGGATAKGTLAVGGATPAKTDNGEVNINALSSADLVARLKPKAKSAEAA